MRTKFKNASEAFDYFYIKIKDTGADFDGTKALFNVGFYIADPASNKIKSGFRKWNKEYADAEWQWYLSGDPSIKKLGNICDPGAVRDWCFSYGDLILITQLSFSQRQFECVFCGTPISVLFFVLS